MKWLQILVDLGPVLGDTKSLSLLLLGFVLCEYKMNTPRVRILQLEVQGMTRIFKM